MTVQIQNRTSNPVVLTQPRTIELHGTKLELLAEAGSSPRASVVRHTVAPGFAAPPALHHHVEDDVTMVVLSGTLAVTGVDGELLVNAGETCVIPHGTPFAWRNASDEQPMSYLAVYAPGGFEQYFVALSDAAAAGRGLTPDVVLPLWGQYGIAVS